MELISLCHVLKHLWEAYVIQLRWICNSAPSPQRTCLTSWVHWIGPSGLKQTFRQHLTPVAPTWSHQSPPNIHNWSLSGKCLEATHWKRKYLSNNCQRVLYRQWWENILMHTCRLACNYVNLVICIQWGDYCWNRPNSTYQRCIAFDKTVNLIAASLVFLQLL